MKRTAIWPPSATGATGAYSPGILIDGWLFVSGQGPVDLDTGMILHGTVEEETVWTLSRVSQIVEAAGGSMADIVKCTVHLADITEFDRYDKVYGSFFSGIKPARTTVESVLSDGIKIEIDAIAKINILQK